MSVYSDVKFEIKELFSDGEIHSTSDIRERLDEKKIDYKKRKNIIGNILFGLKQEGFLKAGERKGEYILNRDNSQDKINKAENPNKNVYLEEDDFLKSDIDFSDFVMIKPQSPREPELKLNVYEIGEIRLNSPLQRALKSRSVEVFLEKDCSRVLLKPDGENVILFTKAGTAKNRDIVKMMKNLNMEFPVIYIVKWNSKYGIWEGRIAR